MTCLGPDPHLSCTLTTRSPFIHSSVQAQAHSGLWRKSPKSLMPGESKGALTGIQTGGEVTPPFPTRNTVFYFTGSLMSELDWKKILTAEMQAGDKHVTLGTFPFLCAFTHPFSICLSIYLLSTYLSIYHLSTSLCLSQCLHIFLSVALYHLFLLALHQLSQSLSFYLSTANSVNTNRWAKVLPNMSKSCWGKTIKTKTTTNRSEDPHNWISIDFLQSHPESHI